ncbi:hypothetical protein B0H14DRAFT_2573315 [Mycena olivaceomarginata]|nr:hypothetical protein B0H14DRAFT_2573315 [Mycena olivaceomarginata]
MSSQIAASIVTFFPVTQKTLEILADNLSTPFLEIISTTTESLLENIEGVKQNKNECALVMEQTHKLLNAIIIAHMKSHTCGNLPTNVLNHIGKFTKTLHKIHTFVEAQQNNSKIKRFSIRDCKAGLQEGFDFFQIKSVNLVKDIGELHEELQKRHQEVLGMIEALSDTSSDQASSACLLHSEKSNTNVGKMVNCLQRSESTWDLETASESFKGVSNRGKLHANPGNLESPLNQFGRDSLRAVGQKKKDIMNT